VIVRALERAGQKASRASVQRWIEAGRVTLDGGAARASQALAAGARIVVRPEAPPPTRALPDASVELVVVYEDAHLLVVDKPAGLVVHPARGHATGTLVNGLLARGGFDLPDDDDARARPGVVHRLDKGTSGLLVVAKDEPTREALKALFAKHAIDREYVAIVAGRTGDATYDTLHGRHPSDRLRFTTRVDAGKRAVTHVKKLEELGAATLVACTLETGRTHQIRVHLAERANAPVLGDPLYGKPPKEARLREVAAELGRQALHARVLGFVHPATGARVRWESAPPPDFARALAALRAAR
jgi:23S rRNA pseudouridine1911/1915/1917 synthase